MGLDFNQSPAAYDISLYTEFASKEDLNAYQVHHLGANSLRCVYSLHLAVEYALDCLARSSLSVLGQNNRFQTSKKIPRS